MGLYIRWPPNIRMSMYMYTQGQNRRKTQWPWFFSVARPFPLPLPKQFCCLFFIFIAPPVCVRWFICRKSQEEWWFLWRKRCGSRVTMCLRICSGQKAQAKSPFYFFYFMGWLVYVHSLLTKVPTSNVNIFLFNPFPPSCECRNSQLAQDIQYTYMTWIPLSSSTLSV